METSRHSPAARRNVRRARARARPERRTRRRPGSTGEGKYYRIIVRPKSRFTTFRTQDVGRPGHIQRVAGRRPSGSWATVSWLIAKSEAHLERGRLVPDTPSARKILRQLGSAPVRVSGDRFKASDRPNVPERSKPTPAQRRARSRNIKKAQAAVSRRG
jgi:hypothetical protein